jgi:hypothetical protein
MAPIAIIDFTDTCGRLYTGPDMTNRLSVQLSIAATLLVSAPSALAHHGSNISYQLDKTITLNGTVTEWDFVNPHPQIYFDIRNDQGETIHWVAEVLPTPLMMKNMQVGWTRKTMQPGDRIVLTCNPSRIAGAKACLAKGLVINGKTWPIVPGANRGPAGKSDKQ